MTPRYPASARAILQAHRDERGKRRIVTVPNIISLVRLVVMMPLFAVVLIAFHSPFWALIVAIVLGVSDYVDGQIARRFHQRTYLGERLDPIADRISQIVVSASMVVVGYIPLWMAIVVAAFDLVLGVTLVVKRKIGIPVRWIGRVRTAFLMAGLPLVLLSRAIPGHPAWLVVTGIVVVGIGVVLHALADGLYVVSLLRGTADAVKDAHPEEQRSS